MQTTLQLCGAVGEEVGLIKTRFRATGKLHTYDLQTCRSTPRILLSVACSFYFRNPMTSRHHEKSSTLKVKGTLIVRSIARGKITGS